MSIKDRLPEANTDSSMPVQCCDTGLRRIDGVSEEMDAEGQVTNTFEYFRQPDEDLGRPTNDIRPDVTDLSNETVCSLAPPPGCMCGPPVAPDVCPRQVDLVKGWQRHWVLIRGTGTAIYSSTNAVGRDGFEATGGFFGSTNQTNSTVATTTNYATRLTTLLINKGCGAERNRVALGQFAAYVQQQWSAMHEEDTTCPYCGQQFLPSLIEEHEDKCVSRSYGGGMFDYLKPEPIVPSAANINQETDANKKAELVELAAAERTKRTDHLYTRIENGDYTLRVEPKSAATGETRMGLVLVKEVTCNSCGLKFQANELESHRRWDCKWTTVHNNNEVESPDKEPVLRRTGLLAPSQDFTDFKKIVEGYRSML